MCTACLSRRRFLQGAVLAAPAATAGCGVPILVSDAEAAEMGRQAWSAIRAKTPLSRNTGHAEVVGRVAGQLLRAGGYDPRDWELAVFAGNTVNAFALPGRKIGIYDGMLNVTRTDGQLAAVIGHEIGHIEAEHSKERMSAEMAGNTVLRVVSWLLNLGEVQYAEEIAAALGVGVEFGLLRPYGRGQEEEADLLGLRLMGQAGFAGREAIAFWERMEAQTGRGPEFLSTHPAPRSRIEALREAIGDPA